LTRRGMSESLSDQELITGCIRKQKESWDVFVERFSKLIYWSIWKVLGTCAVSGKEDLAHEIFQEIFEKLLEKNELKKLKQIASVRKFLTVMASHAALDKIKILGRRERRLDVLETPDRLQTGVQAVSREKDVLIAQVIEALSPKERLCVEWHYMDGKTHREISETLGLSQDTVSTIIRRSKEKIRKIFLEKGLLE